MPCYQVVNISVDLNTSDIGLLKEALKHLKLQFTESKSGITVRTPGGNIVIGNGKATYDNENCSKYINQIKKAYSFKTIEQVAKKYKFTLTAKPNDHYVMRRY